MANVGGRQQWLAAGVLVSALGGAMLLMNADAEPGLAPGLLAGVSEDGETGDGPRWVGALELADPAARAEVTFGELEVVAEMRPDGLPSAAEPADATPQVAGLRPAAAVASPAPEPGTVDIPTSAELPAADMDPGMTVPVQQLESMLRDGPPPAHPAAAEVAPEPGTAAFPSLACAAASDPRIQERQRALAEAQGALLSEMEAVKELQGAVQARWSEVQAAMDAAQALRSGAEAACAGISAPGANGQPPVDPVDQVARMIQGMKPDAAARVLEAWELPLAAAALTRLPPRVSAPIVSALPPKVAGPLMAKLASHPGVTP